MADSFQGWLIKFGGVVLPNSFILMDGWESTPNQRLEIDAYRDAKVLLHRETAKDFKTSIKLNIRETTLKEREAISNVINLASLPAEDRRQRRVSVTYWNDETLGYASGIFYISDIPYSIHKIGKNDLIYNAFSIELTEY